MTTTEFEIEDFGQTYHDAVYNLSYDNYCIITYKSIIINSIEPQNCLNFDSQLFPIRHTIKYYCLPRNQ
jgi:hypothetical protein